MNITKMSRIFCFRDVHQVFAHPQQAGMYPRPASSRDVSGEAHLSIGVSVGSEAPDVHHGQKSFQMILFA